MADLTYIRKVKENDFYDKNIGMLNEFAKDSLKTYKIIEKTAIFVGKTRNGKSTTIEIIKDSTYISPNPEMFSKTKNASVFDVYFEIGDSTKYVFHCMDTPGLKEVHSIDSTEERRGDDIIENIIIDCANFNILYIDVIFITLRMGVTIDPTEFEILAHLTELFKDAKNNFCLLFTGCENLNDSAKLEFKEKLFKHPDFQKYVDLFTYDSIYFSGAVTHQIVASTDVGQFEILLENIQVMRYNIINKIKNAEYPISVKSIDSFRARQEQINIGLRQLSNLKADYVQGKNRQFFTEAYKTVKKLQRYLTNSERAEFTRYQDIHDNPSHYSVVQVFKAKG